ncbi:hypothetical protein EHP00_141 [Ecytonucleospora hepatopenaei]|uniref:Uncharacterized protein n=1 Tax=Ecytonucleospora hepatopenaei TaxID=646526 RepID=A0A1W0E5W4_9MICR|nr:hypothetical protein EHP00_141 [Ecytonucleospora hepatopenaei]
MINGESDKKLKHLTKQVKFCEKIDQICTKVLIELKNTDYKTMQSFKPYILPKENIKKLLDFYEKYTETRKGLEKIKIKLEKSEILQRTLKIKELEALEITTLLEKYKGYLNNLEIYKQVNIVDALIKESQEFFDSMVEKIKKSFVMALNRLPKIVNKIDVYAYFLLQHCDKKQFLGDYTKRVYSRLGFLDINNNLQLLVQQTSNLTKYFNLITQMNAEILGKREAYNINVGLVSLIIVNLKKVMVDTLLVVDKQNKASDIPLLIDLHYNLKHKEGKQIKEIEELFVFKQQIEKLVLNCLIQFFADLELLEHPRDDLCAENVCKIITKALDSFAKNQELKEDWSKKYGRSFGIYNVCDLNTNISTKCLNKIVNLSSQLKEFDKYVYLINNKACFRHYADNFDNLTFKKSINKDVQLIVGLWKIKLEAYKGLVLNRYLTSRLKAHAKYFLPEKERHKVQEAIKTIVESLIVRKMIEGQTNHLKEAIENTYTGIS